MTWDWTQVSRTTGEHSTHLCVYMPKFVCYRMLVYLWICCCSRIHIYICLRIYWHASLYIYKYFRCLFLRKGEMNEESVRREEWVRGCRKWIVAIWIIFFSLILPNFMAAKGLFYINMKSLFCGEFCWIMMMIKIKIITTLLFFFFCIMIVLSSVVWYCIYG